MLDILHKTGIGGVRLGLTDDEAVRLAFREINEAAERAHPEARVDGVLVQAR